MSVVGFAAKSGVVTKSGTSQQVSKMASYVFMINIYVKAAASQCQTDTFSVSNSNGPAPPVICGTNSGEHSMILMALSISFI